MRPGPSRAIFVLDPWALVTAGASGIGRVRAEAFAGAEIPITDVGEAAIDMRFRRFLALSARPGRISVKGCGSDRG